MALATLKNTTEKLQVLLAGSVSASECPGTVTYQDSKKDAVAGGFRGTPVEDSDDFITTGGTAVDVVDPPPTGIRRVITGFSLYNDDTASVTVTVRKYVSSTVTRIVFYGALLTNESLYYAEGDGWFAVNANGERKLSSSADISNASSQASSMAQLIPASVSSQASSIALAVIPNSVNSVSSQASSIALAVIPNSVNSVSSQASSIALAVIPNSVNSVSSQASSMAALVPASVSSQASLAAVHSSIYSLVSVQSFTDSTWSTASSAVSRLKTSFTW